ncbi:hypothetical protein ACWKSP_26745 [Micromonosporaceae bacterium Da 78-11]
MDALGTLVGTFVVQLPILAVLIVGLALLSSSRGRLLPARSGLLARAGLGMLLAHSLAALAWSALLPQLIMQTNFGSGSLTLRSYGLISAVVGFMLSLLFAAGLGLLVAALLGAGRPPDPPGAYQAVGYPAFNAGHQPAQPAPTTFPTAGPHAAFPGAAFPGDGPPSADPPTTGLPAADPPTARAPIAGAPASGAPTDGSFPSGAPTHGSPTGGAPTHGSLASGAPTDGHPSH